MRIAVTGGSGFLGRYIIRQLIGEQHQLRCWYRPTSNRRGLDGSGWPIEWVVGDLSQSESADQLIQGCDALVHSALWRPGAAFQGQEGDLVQFAMINVIGTLRLFEMAVKANVQRIVFISTCAVHDQILDDRPLDETHPLWPASHYGAHKAALEAFVHSYGKGHGLSISSLRPTGIYGIAESPEQSKWFDLVQAVVQGRPVVCRRGGKEVHAADVARAVSLLLTSEGVAGEVYNCCDQYISEYDVASITRELSGSRSEIDGEPISPKHQIDTSKIRSLGMEFGGSALLRDTIAQLMER